jgi:UDP-N-acetyl-D-glucosamine dehydrogenase
MSILNDLNRKINDNTAKIGIIGLGYVGLPLAICFAKKFEVIGFDPDKDKIKSLESEISYINGVSNAILKKYTNKNFFPTNKKKFLNKCDFLIICVPTPLTENNEPDLSHVIKASKLCHENLRKGSYVILQSTTYPGTTDEVVVPILEEGGLKAGRDFGVAYSPERVDPGNKKYTIENTPKVVGGINDECTLIAAKLFEAVIDADIIRLADCKTAEAVKMMENVFRGVNIALVNEMTLIFEKMGINIWAVVKAASTKPYGFMPFYPGPGIGGHCIPLDPFYLSYKAKKVGHFTRFIELSGEINEFMKIHVVNIVSDALKKINKEVRNSNIVIFGLAYKNDIGDTRESPAIKIIEELVKDGGKITVYDPYVKSIKTKQGDFFSESSTEDALNKADCAVFVTDHSEFKNIDIEIFSKKMKNPIIIDCKNIFSKPSNDVIYYGIGKVGRE